MACSIGCSGALSRGQMYTVKALYLHLGLLSIYSNCSTMPIVVGRHRGVTHLSSKDSPAMVKVTIHEV